MLQHVVQHLRHVGVMMPVSMQVAEHPVPGEYQVGEVVFHDGRRATLKAVDAE